MNLYEYVGGSPAVFLDAMGLTKNCDVKKCYELGNRYADLMEELEPLGPRADELSEKIPDHSDRIRKLQGRFGNLAYRIRKYRRELQHAKDQFNQMNQHRIHMADKFAELMGKAPKALAEFGVGHVKGKVVETGFHYGRLTHLAPKFVARYNTTAAVWTAVKTVWQLGSWTIDLSEAHREWGLADDEEWYARKLERINTLAGKVSKMNATMKSISNTFKRLHKERESARAKLYMVQDEIRAKNMNISKVLRCWRELKCSHKLGWTTYLADFATARQKGKPLVYTGD